MSSIFNNRELPEAAKRPDCPDDVLLNVHQAAIWLGGCAVSWLNIARSKKRGPKYVKIGPHMVRYRVGDLRQYVHERTVATDEGAPILPRDIYARDPAEQRVGFIKVHRHRSLDAAARASERHQRLEAIQRRQAEIEAAHREK